MAVYTQIDDPSAHFKVQLYTGTGSSNAITFNDTDTDMAPDLVWVKKRDATGDHYANDSVRGVTKKLEINSTSQEETDANSLTAFGSDGFTVGSTGAFNSSSNTFVAWCWKESATAGFDIVSFTGNATDDRDISHSLSAVPHFWITRNRADVENWVVYHHKNTSAPETDYLVLDDTNATGDSSGVWSDEAPTSSVYTVGTANSVNGNTDAMITYLWTGKQGFSKFGSYTGNGNADGNFIYTGFRPAFILLKNTGNASAEWRIYDNKRDPSNVMTKCLQPHESDAEQTTSNIDFLSNGWKVRSNDGNLNQSGYNFIYYAVAESPFVNSNGVPNNAR